MDTIETIADLFDQIYNEIIKRSSHDNLMYNNNITTSNNIKNYDEINKKLYLYLMKKKYEVLCASASNPMNADKLLFELTAKDYNIKAS